MGLTMYVGLIDDDLEEEEKEDAQQDLERIKQILESNQMILNQKPEGRDACDYWNFMLRYGFVEQFQGFVEKLKKQGDIGLSDETIGHLLEHSGYDGYFLPMDFEHILIDDECQLSSCVKIREICLEVARYLELPVPLNEMDIDYSGEGDEIHEMFGKHREKGGKWTEHEIEALLCIVLYQGATVALKTGEIMAFG